MAKIFDALGMNTPGREGSGMATIYDSGNFDGAKFVQDEANRKRDLALAEKNKAQADKKNANAKLFDILTKYPGSTTKGMEEIGGFSNKLVDNLAEVMMKPNQDPLDPMTEAGSLFVKGINQIQGMAAADKMINEARGTAMKLARDNPGKFDLDYFDEQLGKLDSAATIDEQAKIAQEGLLKPYYDYNDLMKQVTVGQSFTETPKGNQVVREYFYDPQQLQANADAIVANPSNAPFIAQLEKDIAAGKVDAESPQDYFIKQKNLTVKTYDDYSKPYKPSSDQMSVFGGGIGFSQNGYNVAINHIDEPDAYKSTDTKEANYFVVDRESGQTAGTPELRLTTKDGKEIQATGTWEFKRLANGDWTVRGDVKETKPIASMKPSDRGKTEEVERTLEFGEVMFDNKNITKFRGETGIDLIPMVQSTARKGGLIYTNPGAAKPKTTGKTESAGKTATLADIKALVGKPGYDGYTEKELIDYYKSLGYEIK